MGLSRQIVNQHLQSWKIKGWIDIGRGKITIVDEAALHSLVAGSETP
jgi:DNA-binding FadR family transcriptional regulator